MFFYESFLTMEKLTTDIVPTLFKCMGYYLTEFICMGFFCSDQKNLHAIFLDKIFCLKNPTGFPLLLMF